ncbi:MAG TPA: TAXI family TRAP transporter solute-binding subunit [Steroidobacteraceae bacterium]|nr:TAXI family TRAP transporter solute-binding subunit [Steroidobacteraceae bacterium]
MESNSESGSAGRRHGGKLRLPLKITTVSWSDLLHTLGPILLASALAIWAAWHFGARPPPHSLTMSGGPKGSSFENDAEKYRAILARSGIDLKIIPSVGSLQNLDRLADPHSHVDIALVQAGLAAEATARQGADTSDIVSLGSMFYQPLTIFYRGRRPISRLSQLKGKRIAIGKTGSGTRLLALALLDANGIDSNGPSLLLDLEGEAAHEALLERRVDAIFLTGDSAPTATIRALLHTRGIRMFNFTQAAAYTRRFPYLHELQIPEGTFDLGANLPAKPLTMLAPAVEMIARSGLHPALCDLLIEAAQEVHGRATLLQSAHQFPSTYTSYPLASEAARYYKSGRSFTYRYLPFWVASLVNRIAVVLVPILIILIPGLRYLPNLYRWRVDARIHRRYGELMALERESLEKLTPERRAALLERLEEIERAVILRKIPGSHAEHLYQLREHIEFVRMTLDRSTARTRHQMQAAGTDLSGSVS